MPTHEAIVSLALPIRYIGVVDRERQASSCRMAFGSYPSSSPSFATRDLHTRWRTSGCCPDGLNSEGAPPLPDMVNVATPQFSSKFFLCDRFRLACGIACERRRKTFHELSTSRDFDSACVAEVRKDSSKIFRAIIPRTHRRKPRNLERAAPVRAKIAAASRGVQRRRNGR